MEYCTTEKHTKKIQGLLLLKDKIRSLITLTKKSRTKQKLRWKMEKTKIKQDQLIDDLHNKVVSDLTQNYQSILLPEFKISEMIQKNKLGKMTKRMLMSFKYYKFQNRLKEKCIENARTLYIVDESFTSKTCGRCGHLNTKLGCSKVFKCPKCNLEIDRDVNGARNILLKNLKVLKIQERATSPLKTSKQLEVNKIKVKPIIVRKSKQL